MFSTSKKWVLTDFNFGHFWMWLLATILLVMVVLTYFSMKKYSDFMVLLINIPPLVFLWAFSAKIEISADQVSYTLWPIKKTYPLSALKSQSKTSLRGLNQIEFVFDIQGKRKTVAISAESKKCNESYYEWLRSYDKLRNSV